MALDTSLISYFKLDESSGNAADSVGSNTLTNTAATYTTGKINNGASFNGSTGKLINSSPTGLPTGDATRTLSFWMYPTSVASTNGCPINFGTAATAYRDTPHIYNGGSGTFDISISGESYTLPNTFVVNNWYHIAITNVTGNKTIKTYVNGVLSLSQLFSNSINTLVAGLSVGCEINSTSFFYGLVDEVAIWSRELSADEVSQIFNSGRGNSYPFTATPILYGGVAYYKLDETTGNAIDSIGGNTGVNTNVTYAVGKINNGAVFNGSSSKLVLPNIGVSGSIARTWSAWINTTTISVQQCLFTSGVDSPLTLFSAYINTATSGNGGIYIYLSGEDYYAASLISINTWHNVSIVYDGGELSTSTIHLYVDGVSKTLTQNGSSGGALNTTNSGYKIGLDVGDLWSFNGKIDEQGIFNRALSQVEITALYNSGLGNQYPFSFTPTLTTDVITNLDITSVTANGTVISDNGATVSERGFVYSNTTNPTIVTGTKVVVAGTTGSYSYDVTGLLKNNTYYLKAYATNSFGTAYGAEVVFTTLNLDADTFYKNINGIEGQTYSVSCNIGGTVGTVTVKLGTTGTSQVINAGAGVTTFQGTYGGLTGLIFEKSDTFDGTVDDVMWVLITGDAIIDWTLNSLTNIYPINSAVKFKRVEDKNLTRFDLYRYLDVMFKDLDGYVTLTVSKEANDTSTSKSKEFVVGNTGTEVSPFVKKRVSMLQKGQALLIQFSNNKLNETFTICQFSLTGTQDSPRLYKLSKIISV
jgi:hypothetical protein